jgi:hypothetical protein
MRGRRSFSALSTMRRAELVSRCKAFDDDRPRLDKRFLALPAAYALVGEGNGCAIRVTVQDEWADLSKDR